MYKCHLCHLFNFNGPGNCCSSNHFAQVQVQSYSKVFEPKVTCDICITYLVTNSQWSVKEFKCTSFNWSLQHLTLAHANIKHGSVIVKFIHLSLSIASSSLLISIWYCFCSSGHLLLSVYIITDSTCNLESPRPNVLENDQY